MGRLFNLDSPVIVFLERMLDLTILSVLWLICCIPIVTIASSTASLYYVTLKIVKDEDNGIIKSFFHAFKDNFLQGIPQSLFFLLAGAALYLNYAMIAPITGAWLPFFQFLFAILAAYYLCTMFYTFPLQAQFSNTVTRTLRDAFALAIQNPINSLIILLINLIPFGVFMLALDAFVQILPFWFLLAPGVIAYLCSRRFSKLFAPIIEEKQKSQ